MKPYDAIIEKLYRRIPPRASKTSLETISSLVTALGNPQHNYQVVHCAGTNGKGSTVTKIANALHYDGRTVGLYTSPHITCYRERITVDGVMISEEEVVSLLSEIFDLGIDAMFFEMTTALALLYFARKNVDIAVIETGIGGRLDATNVVFPVVSVITSISSDHIEYLGESLCDIAREKAGIIKPEVPVILGPKARGFGIEDIAVKRGSSCIEVKGSYDNVDDENSAIAKKALELLGVKQNSIQHGVSMRPPCRYEKHVIDGVTIIFDVAHNSDGLKRLFSTVRMHYPHSNIRVVIGMCSDKDMKECLHIVSMNSSSVHLVSGGCHRCAPIETLAALLVEKNAEMTMPTVVESVRYAICEAKKDGDVVVVCGSFYIMEEARILIDGF